MFAMKTDGCLLQALTDILWCKRYLLYPVDGHWPTNMVELPSLFEDALKDGAIFISQHQDTHFVIHILPSLSSMALVYYFMCW